MDKFFKWAAIAMMVALIALAGYGYFKFNAYEKQIVKLQNEIASRDTTIEVQKQVYAKLALQLDDLKTVIDANTEEGRKLKEELKKNKAELVAVNNSLILLKDQVANGSGNQTQIGERKKVSFEKDFGYAKVTGFTLTDPPEYQLKLGQGSKPLKLTMALAQQKDGSWKQFVTSSDENVGIDIGVTAVNPYIFEPSWYEKVKIHIDLGVGAGVLGGVGGSYQVGQFDFGPSIWGVVNNGSGGVFYGLNLSWAPFKSTRP